jgi:signal transduction histidine kinase
VPLWSERGLIGVLLLGEKRDGSLYTQEEIEIARTSAERLMALQREWLAQSQVLDRRARRVLHDDVLPRLHAALLTLSSGERTSEAVTLLTDAHRQVADLLHEMPTVTAPEVVRLGLIGALRQAVDEEFAGAFDDVTWEIEPLAERKARAIPSLTAEVLYYASREAIRNAARHGRDADTDRPLNLRVDASWRAGLTITIADDGVGLGTSQPSEGSGHGLALHSTMMAVVGGMLAVESSPGACTRVSLRLPEGAWSRHK